MFDLSIGPVCYVIFCEISATKVRTKTISVATASQALVGIVMTVAIPYMINPDQANMRGKMGFFFGKYSLTKFFLAVLHDFKGKTTNRKMCEGGLSIICFVWCWVRIPETKGRTYEELDLMFARGVKTREFKNYNII